MTTPAPMSTPQAGGVKNQVIFTGGIPGAANPKPRTPMWYRPDDPDKATKVYKHAVTGLENKLKGSVTPNIHLKASPLTCCIT